MQELRLFEQQALSAGCLCVAQPSAFDPPALFDVKQALRNTGPVTSGAGAEWPSE